MKPTLQLKLLTLGTLVVLITSLINPQIVRADDGIPTPEATVETTPVPETQNGTAPIGEVSTSNDSLPTETLSPENTPDVAIEPTTDMISTEEILTSNDLLPVETAFPENTPSGMEQVESPDESSQSEEQTETHLPITQILPDNTELVIIDATGQAEPLASQSAAEAIASGDPMWCPAGVTPGGIGCTVSYSNLTSLLAAMGSIPNQDGVIWIQNGTITEPSAVAINQLSNTASLTLQGGWSGVYGDTGVVSNSTFNAPISITWGGNIIINDLVLDLTGATSATYGLDINTPQNIVLENVSVINNENGGGAILSSTGTLPAGNVTLTGTNTFNNNQGTGLFIFSDNNVNLNNITANNNGGGGATILAHDDITMTGTNSFNNNAGTVSPGLNIFPGLEVESYYGSIDLSNVSASGNSQSGAVINNSDHGGVGNITLSGTNSFHNDGGVGLVVFSSSTLDLNNITANENGNTGARLNASGDVTMNGTNNFNNNSVDNNHWVAGFSILTTGNINLSNVTANENNLGAGALLNNTYGTGNVSIIGTNSFSQNGSEGLVIFSDGSIWLNNINANNNQNDGAFLYSGTYNSTTSVNLTGINTFKNNLGNGLVIEAQNVSISCSEFVSNSKYGLRVGGTPEQITLNNNLFSLNSLGNHSIISGTQINFTENPCSERVPGKRNLEFESTNGGKVPFACDLYSGLVLILPNGSLVKLPCGKGDSASAMLIPSSLLPKSSWQGEYISALEFSVFDQVGKPIQHLDPRAIVSFKLPEGESAAGLSILFWDGKHWIDLGGKRSAEGEYFEIPASKPGMYMLVKQ